MTELNKDELKKIAYNCKKATFLIEKKQVSGITPREKLELKIHLAGCSVCRIFEQQSFNINRLVKELFQGAKNNEIKLDDSFKTDLQDRIDRKLNKK